MSKFEELRARGMLAQMTNEEKIKELIKARKCTPCYFGSGLKGDGVDEFIGGLEFMPV